MPAENLNPDCRRDCPRFQEAQFKDRANNTLSAFGYGTPGFFFLGSDANHWTEEAVAEDTAGCPGPERLTVPNRGILHRTLGIGPDKVERVICMASEIPAKP
jgi:hypothetical protein